VRESGVTAEGRGWSRDGDGTDWQVRVVGEGRGRGSDAERACARGVGVGGGGGGSRAVGLDDGSLTEKEAMGWDGGGAEMQPATLSHAVTYLYRRCGLGGGGGVR
jgi:hypothetical protein